jgi:hypothetical protein
MLESSQSPDALAAATAAGLADDAGLDLEHDETERRWLRTRLLAVLPSEARPVDEAVADALAAIPGDVCLVVTGWLTARLERRAVQVCSAGRMSRIGAWWRYRRRLASSMAEHFARAGHMSADTCRRLQAEARKDEG